MRTDWVDHRAPAPRREAERGDGFDLVLHPPPLL